MLVKSVPLCISAYTRPCRDVLLEDAAVRTKEEPPGSHALGMSISISILEYLYKDLFEVLLKGDQIHSEKK